MSQAQAAYEQRAKVVKKQLPAPINVPTPTSGRGQSPLTQGTIQRALANPANLSPLEVMQLQRTVGNHAVNSFLPRTLIDQRSEHGTDAGITNGKNNTAGQDIGAPKGSGVEGGDLDSDLSHSIQRARSGGSALSEGVAAEIEARTGLNGRAARIHTGAKADTLNRQLNAEAFTVGRDLFFRNGAYNPGSVGGKKLLAHELTHVAQQGRGQQSNASPTNVQAKVRVGPASDTFEQEADQVARSYNSVQNSAPHGVAPSGVGNSNPPTLQRLLAFKPEQLLGQLSQSAIRSEKLGKESSFSKLQRYLKEYWQSRTNSQLQFKLLAKMDETSATWLTKHVPKQGEEFKSGKKAQYESVAQLSSAVKQEIAAKQAKRAEMRESEAYMNKFSVANLRQSTSAIVRLDSDPFAVGKQISHNNRRGIANPKDLAQMETPDGRGGTTKSRTMRADEREQEYQKYLTHKANKLTPGQRAALNAYTNEQYRLMNPALDNNMEWMKQQMGESSQTRAHVDDDKIVKSAVADNLEIAKMTQSALQKLPLWKHVRTLYRGDTVTQAIADEIKLGYVRKYNYFVSTSTGDDTPRTRANKYKTTERPWAVIYHINNSRNGRDISPYSDHPGEEEILFAPNTSFRVDKILKYDRPTKQIEIVVSEL